MGYPETDVRIIDWLKENPEWFQYNLNVFRKIIDDLKAIKACPFCGYAGEPKYHGAVIDDSKNYLWVCPVKLLSDHIERYLNGV